MYVPQRCFDGMDDGLTGADDDTPVSARWMIITPQREGRWQPPGEGRRARSAGGKGEGGRGAQEEGARGEGRFGSSGEQGPGNGPEGRK